MQHTPDRAAAVAAIAQMVAAAADHNQSRTLMLAERMLAMLDGAPVANVRLSLTPDQEREIAGLRAGGHA